MTTPWKKDFSTGERFRIKGHLFEISHIGKRGLTFRKISAQSEAGADNQNNSETDAEKKENQK